MVCSLTLNTVASRSRAVCGVPAVPAKESTRPAVDHLTEVASAAAEGVTEVNLLGQNMNSYGRHLGLCKRQAGADTKVRPMFAELFFVFQAEDGIRGVPGT